jgi:hypothetical protein
LELRHPDYLPLDLSDISGAQLCVARLIPRDRTPPLSARAQTLANVVIKYTILTTTTVNVGSAVKTFQVANNGNVPCGGNHPCSPDGKWQAAEATAVIDAGPGNEVRNARVSCIAGPCPFTRTDPDKLVAPHGSRTVQVTARNWSDTATFLLEAEVYKTIAGEILRHSYPQIFGRALTFTLPAEAEGVSIQADLDGEAIIFPLGPALRLGWADCQVVINQDKTRVYRCELKQGYKFSPPGIH